MCQSFNEAFAFDHCVVAYNRAWSNGKGGYNLTHLPDIQPGSIIKSLSPGGRRILIIGTVHGSLVLGDLFTQQGREPAGRDVVLAWMPKAIEKIVGPSIDGRLDNFSFRNIYGNRPDGRHNIGKALTSKEGRA